ncbi:MAG: hypothetical protein ABW065_12770 [Solirubrobacterales bacterium]
MRAANPVSVAELSQVGEAELSAALRRAIAIGETAPRLTPVGAAVASEGDEAGRTKGRRAGGSMEEMPPGRGVLSRHRSASLGLGFACVVAIAAVVLLTGGSVGSVRDGGHPTYAAAAVEVAEANPRLLVTAPGWSIVHARGFEVDSGELIYKFRDRPAFGPGSQQLELDWYPARFYRSYLRDRAAATPRGGVSPAPSTVLGRRASTFHYAGQRPNFSTILAPQGSVFVEIHGTLAKGKYEKVVRSLRPVGVDAWLAAMPPEVVQPAARSEEIAAMLEGLPVPPGFDPSALQSDSVLSDHFMLGKAVAGAVACDWLRRWSSATREGDGATAQQAVEAMGTARRWPVLLRMVRERGYEGSALPLHGQGWPSQIVAAGREIAAGRLRRQPAVRTIYVKGEPAGYITPADVAPASALGCDLPGSASASP